MRRLRPLGPLLVLALIAAGLWIYLSRGDAPGVRETAGAGGAALIAEAYRAERSDLWVEAGGVVERTLADDNEGSRHQRFIVRLPTGQTVLVSHNIDLAPRVPLETGDHIEFRGEYEWNERGGVVHWTHHDPQGRHEGGWLRHRGRTIR